MFVSRPWRHTASERLNASQLPGSSPTQFTHGWGHLGRRHGANCGPEAVQQATYWVEFTHQLQRRLSAAQISMDCNKLAPRMLQPMISICSRSACSGRKSEGNNIRCLSEQFCALTLRRALLTRRVVSQSLCLSTSPPLVGADNEWGRGTTCPNFPPYPSLCGVNKDAWRIARVGGKVVNVLSVSTASKAWTTSLRREEMEEASLSSCFSLLRAISACCFPNKKSNKKKPDEDELFRDMIESEVQKRLKNACFRETIALEYL